MTTTALLALLKADNGIPAAETGYDALLEDTVAAAQADLVRAGVPASVAAQLEDADARMAVRLYVKGHLGLSYDEKYDAIYEDALKRLTAGGADA